MIPAIYLYPAHQINRRNNHPWIFAKMINRTKGKLVTGELVHVFSAEDELIGIGVYNEFSLYRVRILAQPWEITSEFSLNTLLKQRFKQALTLRQALNLPNSSTNAFRLFNSEADGLSGLTIDYFNQVCVVSSSAFWVEKHKLEIAMAIKETFACQNLIWLSQQKPLTQDGWSSFVEEDCDLTTEILEGEVQYQINFAEAQKTGLFLDQRENHQRLAALTKGKAVLDLYTYTGGFALHAAKAGASRVTAIDSSQAAIEQARKNASLNDSEFIEFIEADARDYLVNAKDYDVIILDPPKLVPSQKHLQRAKNYYRFLHREVFKNMRSGSLLMTCNCSSALSSAEFCQLIEAQALAVNKPIRFLGVFGPASCHPTLPAFPEGNYLTAVLVTVV